MLFASNDGAASAATNCAPTTGPAPTMLPPAMPNEPTGFGLLLRTRSWAAGDAEDVEIEEAGRFAGALRRKELIEEDMMQEIKMQMNLGRQFVFERLGPFPGPWAKVCRICLCLLDEYV